MSDEPSAGAKPAAAPGKRALLLALGLGLLSILLLALAAMSTGHVSCSSGEVDTGLAAPLAWLSVATVVGAGIASLIAAVRGRGALRVLGTLGTLLAVPGAWVSFAGMLLLSSPCFGY